MHSPILMGDPEWLPAMDATRPLKPDALMALAVETALASAQHGGGPFGAVVADAQGKPIALGWNAVVETHDSTAHAEIVAIRRAQAQEGSHLLSGHTLYTSCAPCIQCFGAIYWAGLARVVSAATKEDAEAIGFDEGPALDGLWEHALRAKGLEFLAEFQRDEAALAPLKLYAARGGVNYSER